MSCNKIDKYIVELDDAIVNIMNDYKYISIYLPELIKNGIVSNGTLLDLDISIDTLKQKIDSIIYVCGQSNVTSNNNTSYISNILDTTDTTDTNDTDMYVKIYDKLFKIENIKEKLTLPLLFLSLMLMDNNSILNSKTFYEELDSSDKYIEKDITKDITKDIPKDITIQQHLDIELD